MSFHSPLFLLLLIIVPLKIYFYRNYSDKVEATILFPSASLFSKNIRFRAKVKNRVLKCLELIILILIIIALARPQKIDELVKKNVDVIDILLVLDISSSMLADDFSPNRLEVVKKTAKEIQFTEY